MTNPEHAQTNDSVPVPPCPAGDTPVSLAATNARYRKIRCFFARVFVHFIWWDLIMALPLLRWLRPKPLGRWRRIARRYRRLALEMGGVLIKLGQFLSVRFDILPAAVIEELAGLQDEVPPVPLERIVARIKQSFGTPLERQFTWLSPRAIGSASLAQAHLARTTDGTQLVLKVLRPGIEQYVETDLKAIARAFRWLKLYKPVRTRVDLDWLLDEFQSVTRRELDMLAEGRHAEHLARDFVHTAAVYIPRVYWKYSTRQVLALEDVTSIRITDTDAVEQAGICRSDVARTLYRIYMRQVFETWFVHVDPHPGNLFVKPLPPVDAGTGKQAPHGAADQAPELSGRAFQIAFVDFGMVAEIPERLRAALREYAIGVGTQDAAKIVQAYRHAGVLLEGADLKRIEEAHAALFERFWGVRVGQFRQVAAREARHFLHEYRDVILKAPFQFQADMLFVVRAVAMLAGLATRIDPDFDPWANTIPYAERFARQELRRSARDWLRDIESLGRQIFTLPKRVDRVLSRAEHGMLAVRTVPDLSTRRLLEHLTSQLRRLAWSVTASGLLIAGAILYSRGRHATFGLVLLAAALGAFLAAFRK